MGKAEQTRKYIIRKAASIFNMHGYEGTSVSRLTKAIGLTKGAIYGNFKNKDEIALAALEYNVARISEQISLSVRSQTHSCDKLIAFASFYKENFDRMSQKGGCPILNAAIDSDHNNFPLKEYVTRLIENWMDSIVKIITRGIEKKEIREEVSPEAFASLFVSMVEGGVMLSKITGHPIHLNRNIAHLISLINTELREC